MIASPGDIGPGPDRQWPYGLDTAKLRVGGWRPTALREFVLKVHQRCNLACDYCYVYTKSDQSWRHKPTTMSKEVWSVAIGRMAEHAHRHALAEVTVVLHGGEPLLAGVARLAAIAQRVRTAMPSRTTCRIGIQTNGVLLNEATLGALVAHGIRVGVSMDGPATHHDVHRRHADGTGSYSAVHRALTLLGSSRHREAFSGILCAVDLAVDPVACYESLLGFAPPAMDFLLPHANWSAPPAQGAAGGPTYGSWLTAAFDRWYGAPAQETRVRLFEDLLHVLLGGTGHSDQIGLSPSAVVVVDTDGAIEQADSLKSAYPGAPSTGLSVLTDGFDRALEHPGMVARQIGAAALGPTCTACDLRQICGGGHYAHRYRAGTGFRNPSVYCADLEYLIRHVRRRLVADVRARAA